VVCRNQPSERILGAMGVRTAPGTDTAWTFEPSPRERGAEILRAAGWDGRSKVLIVCPVNPCYWPTRPDVIKAAAHELLGEFGFEHYRSIYFHEWSEDAAQRYERYLDGLAEGVQGFARDRKVFTVVAGSERLDRDACERLAARLPDGAPVLVSDELDMFDFVSVLRNASLLVSSRFHAIVTSMPGGVPSIGIATDERISNLMRDRGHEDLLLSVDEDDLGERTHAALRRLERETHRVSSEVLRFVPGEIRKLGEMGIALADETQRVYADFPRPRLPRSYEHHLPPLSPELERLMGEHA
jgi:polysaccharide pyruvyl transferase WcaK-like protein